MREHARRNITELQRAGRIWRDPAVQAEAMRKRCAENPGAVEHMRNMARKSLAARTPESAEKQRRSHRATLDAKHEQRMAWCPIDRRDEYLKLRRQNPAAEAKRIIMDDLAASERRRLAAMTPFERQMEKVRNGARLVEKFTPRMADHAFTLGGVASGQL